MKYMEGRDDSGELKRASLDRVAPWARSVIVCAINYNTAHPYSPNISRGPLSRSPDESGRGWISRYAWGREDYHDSVLRKLRQMETEIVELVHNDDNDNSDDNSVAPQLRSYVDTGPLIERVYAKYAGIGWIAKNTCVINQQLGSWLFLGVILTSIDLSKHDATFDLPAPDRCGTCTRCIAACPTQAIIAPGELDARLCISYLTIEKRGEIAQELRSGMGRHIFGCDICQDVCPWNRKAPVTTAPEFQPREGFVNPALDWLAEMQPEEFAAAFRGSPMKRAKRSGVRRNAVIAMGNSDDKKVRTNTVGVSPKMQIRWSRSTRDGQARRLETDSMDSNNLRDETALRVFVLLRSIQIVLHSVRAAEGPMFQKRFAPGQTHPYHRRRNWPRQGNSQTVSRTRRESLHLRPPRRCSKGDTARTRDLTGGKIDAHACDVRDAAAVEG